jgi:hypothetical protein
MERGITRRRSSGRRLENSVRREQRSESYRRLKGNFMEGIFAKLELRQDIKTTPHGTSP